ncbi:hypothetical protein AL053_03850 [Pseudomonas savastanoi pv. fraxini]|uniref:hypothetical protein n=1 Tax=Pseudomonas TaxID=286 RepID=UPI0004E20216|nr:MULTISPECIES: hypothetical protein [Pseudomonas]KPY78265.1 hypothetical protein ALO58_200049 [Pseudomonas savastanoi pv. savastanoi]KWS70029.1 hypothetical protein AL053_03850 [Pseudomonas savastanoi pv. fraxini]RML73985.1 hypothetical protein ALQ90_200297 [Pseudomonas savastanoi pv. savastanoi]RMR65316.1 hypothetical protein ALP80_200187 [Pseudomonas savastanoi pv. fraxini]TSC28557.1 hypothetical protein FOM00_27690 [Pseudomonas sp. ST1]
MAITSTKATDAQRVWLKQYEDQTGFEPLHQEEFDRGCTPESPKIPSENIMRVVPGCFCYPIPSYGQDLTRQPAVCMVGGLN